jgi:predicted  nucleic acid-binding Zn-ribbon protein
MDNSILQQILTEVKESRADDSRLEATVAGMDSRLSGLETTVAKLDTRLLGVETAVAKLDTTTMASIDRLDSRVTRLETKMNEINNKLTNEVSEIKYQVEVVHRNVASLEGELIPKINTMYDIFSIINDRIANQSMRTTVTENQIQSIQIDVGVLKMKVAEVQ